MTAAGLAEAEVLQDEAESQAWRQAIQQKRSRQILHLPAKNQPQNNLNLCLASPPKFRALSPELNLAFLETGIDCGNIRVSHETLQLPAISCSASAPRNSRS